MPRYLFPAAAMLVFAAAMISMPAAPALAQAEQPAAPPPAAEVAPAEIDKYTNAAVQIEGIRKEAQQRMQGVESREQALSVRQEANQAMAEAVRAEGLTVERYNAISRAAQQDPALREQIIQGVNDKR